MTEQYYKETDEAWFLKILILGYGGFSNPQNNQVTTPVCIKYLV